MPVPIHQNVTSCLVLFLGSIPEGDTAIASLLREYRDIWLTLLTYVHYLLTCLSTDLAAHGLLSEELSLELLFPSSAHSGKIGLVLASMLSIHHIYTISLIGLQVTLIDEVVVGVPGEVNSAVRHLRVRFFGTSNGFLGLVVKDKRKLYLLLITLRLPMLLFIRIPEPMILVADLLTNTLHGPFHLLPAIVLQELGNCLRYGLLLLLVAIRGVHLSVAMFHTVHCLLEVPHFLPGKKSVLRALSLAERVRII
jgi:hypothetical protein